MELNRRHGRRGWPQYRFLPTPIHTLCSMIRVLGIKMAKMTPSRGYSSELAVALVVAVFVYFGLPISTTHCIVS